jgi:hypothetical protein
MHAHKIRIDKPFDRQWATLSTNEGLFSKLSTYCCNGTGFGTLHKDFHYHSAI